MRLDKFLKNSRIIKRRTVAKEACDKGRVSVNGKVAKAGTEVSEGDVLEILFGANKLKVRVEKTADSIKKEAAGDMYTPV